MLLEELIAGWAEVDNADFLSSELSHTGFQPGAWRPVIAIVKGDFRAGGRPQV